MLWTIVVVLLVLWALGLATSYTVARVSTAGRSAGAARG